MQIHPRDWLFSPSLLQVVQLCHREGLVLLADEVYQENVYGDSPFVSLRKVLLDTAAAGAASGANVDAPDVDAAVVATAAPVK